jgi:hypothetical protein
VGRFVGRRVLPVLGKGLKALGKAALPHLGKVLGSFIPIPGVGTAIGGALGTLASKALELELSGLSGEEADLEMSRRFVAASSPPDMDLGEFERFGMPGAMQRGRWVRRGRQIVVLGI